MRTLVPLALLALITVTVFASVRFAGAEDPLPAADEVQNRRLDALERQNAFLRAREAKLTAHALKSVQHGESLLRITAEARAGGFATAGNPSGTRERFLAGLEAIGVGLKRDPPVTTTEELRQLEVR